MSIFSWNKKKDKLVLVFDIKSSSVGAALFWTQANGVPKIVFSVREQIAVPEVIEANQFLTAALKSLEVVAARAHRSGIGAPSKIFCILSPLLYVSQTRIIELKKNTPFLFTSKLADSLIQKEIDLFKEEHLEKYMRSGSPVRLIELKNIKTMLNGYETSDPLNQKTEELEMTIFLSMSAEQILGKIEEAIRRGHFHSEAIQFSSFALSSFAVVRDIYTHSESFLLINIGGEMTDISMVKKNILRESVSFPLGFNFMIRGIASASRSSLGEAKSMISLLKDGHATESVENNLGPALDKVKKEWLSKFQESLSNLSNDISVPATIYLVVEKEMEAFFAETIKTEQFNQYTLTESKFEIISLGAEVFHGMASFGDGVARDPGVIIDSVFINRFLINRTEKNKI